MQLYKITATYQCLIEAASLEEAREVIREATIQALKRIESLNTFAGRTVGEYLEDAGDLHAAQEAMQEPGRIPWSEVKKRLESDT